MFFKAKMKRLTKISVSLFIFALKNPYGNCVFPLPFLFIKILNVESEQNHVAVFNDVVFAFGTNFPQFFRLDVTAEFE